MKRAVPDYVLPVPATNPIPAIILDGTNQAKTERTRESANDYSPIQYLNIPNTTRTIRSNCIRFSRKSIDSSLQSQSNGNLYTETLAAKTAFACSNIMNYFISEVTRTASTQFALKLPIHCLFTLSLTNTFFNHIFKSNFQPIQNQKSAIIVNQNRCEYKIEILKEILSNRPQSNDNYIDWLIRYTRVTPSTSLSIYRQNNEIYETCYKTFHPCVLSLAAKYGGGLTLDYLSTWIRNSRKKLYDYAIIGRNISAIIWLSAFNYQVPISKPNLVNGKFWLTEIIKISDEKINNWVLTRYTKDIQELKENTTFANLNHYLAVCLAYGNYSFLGKLYTNLNFLPQFGLETLINALKTCIICKNNTSIAILDKDYMRPNYDMVFSGVLEKSTELLIIAVLFNNTDAMDWVVKTCKVILTHTFLLKFFDTTYIKNLLSGLDYEKEPKINLETMKFLILMTTKFDSLIYFILASNKTPYYFGFDILEALEFLLTIKPISGNILLCRKMWTKVIRGPKVIESTENSDSIVNFGLLKILAKPCHDIPSTANVCSKAAKFGITLSELDELLKYCLWDKMTIINALDFGRPQIAHWAIAKNCPIDFEVACMAKFCNDDIAFNLLMNRNCPWSEELYKDPKARLSACVTLSKNFIRFNMSYVKIFFEKPTTNVNN